MKKTISLILVATSCAFASGENKYLSYNFTDINDNTLRKATVLDLTLNFKPIDANKKDYPIAICKDNKKLHIQQKEYLADNSMILNCKSAANGKSTDCTLKVFNIDYNDNKIQDMLNKKICNNYYPNEIIDTYTFKLDLDTENEIVLGHKYKFKYKMYSAN
jgi:hypothetical protein